MSKIAVCLLTTFCWIAVATGQPALANVVHGVSCNDEECADVTAGYEFAQTQNTRDMSLCSGQSAAFYKGCMQFIYEAGPAPLPDPSAKKKPDAEPGADRDLRDDQERGSSSDTDKDRQ